ncbi:MAG: hypothetical protein FWF69_10585 [Firmicutes bacterium]|nr:hypothetical protein [Bacillota bacterium]
MDNFFGSFFPIHFFLRANAFAAGLHPQGKVHIVHKAYRVVKKKKVKKILRDGMKKEMCRVYMDEVQKRAKRIPSLAVHGRPLCAGGFLFFCGTLVKLIKKAKGDSI